MAKGESGKETRLAKFTGVIQVTGEHDTGKTTFALECGVSPEKMLFLDDDLKGRNTIADLEEAGIKFGRYVDLISLGQGKAELDYHTAVMNLIKEIKPGEFDAIVWDTWTHFASTTHAYVLAHPTEFKKNWAPMGTIKGAQQWQEARRYEAMLISYLSTLAKTVILVTHLKDQYIGKVKVPGRQIPANSSAVERVMRFRLWLRPNPSGRPVPIGLVMKRLDKKHVVDGKIRTVSVLPRKITPLESEHSLWDTIERYWNEPFGDREPTEDELPDSYELSILDGTITQDQMHTMRSMIEHDLVEEDEDEGSGQPDADAIAKIIELRDLGRPLPLIAKEVGMSVARVSGYMKSLPEVNFMDSEEEDVAA